MAQRKLRLEAALRENLKRRKAQAKARSAADAGIEPSGGASHDPAGIVTDKRNR